MPQAARPCRYENHSSCFRFKRLGTGGNRKYTTGQMAVSKRFGSATCESLRHNTRIRILVSVSGATYVDSKFPSFFVRFTGVDFRDTQFVICPGFACGFACRTAGQCEGSLAGARAEPEHVACIPGFEGSARGNPLHTKPGMHATCSGSARA